MKKMLYLFVVCMVLAIPGAEGRFDLYSYEYPPCPDDSDAIYTYCYYTFPLCGGNDPIGFIVLPNTEFYVDYGPGKEKKLGNWRISGDTMLVYHTWKEYDPDAKLHVDSLVDSLVSNNIPIDCSYTSIVGPWYRWLYMPDPCIDAVYPYAANVAAYRIVNYGEALIPVESSGINSSDYLYYKPESVHQAPFYPPFKYAKKVYETVTYPWEKKRESWRKGTYEVVEVTRGLRSVATVTLRKGKVDYTIVKPTSYLPGREPLLYDKADEEALCGWMDTVQVGRRYRFELQRPDYPADSLQHVPYLRTTGRSLYVSKLGRPHQASRQAYGYFFAKII